MTMSAAAILVVPITFIPRRANKWAAIGLVSSAASVIFADLAHVRQFGRVVPITAWLALRQVVLVFDSVQSLFTLGDVWLVVAVISIIVFSITFRPLRHLSRFPKPARLSLHLCVILGCLLAAAPSARSLSRGFKNSEGIDTMYSHRWVLESWGVLFSHLHDWTETFREWYSQTSITPEDRKRITQFFLHRHQTKTYHQPPEEKSSLNVILIQVEALQQWLVGAQVAGQEITPFLNRLQQNALYFPFIFNQANQGRSSDAEFAVLNSLHPLDRGAVAFRRPHNDFVAFPKVLRQYGYDTLSAHAFERSFWNRATVHPAYGFTRSLFRKEMGGGEQLGLGLADHLFLRRIIPVLSSLQRPFFAFLTTLYPHEPFNDFPAHRKMLKLGPLEDTRLGNYLHAMHYIDGALDQFLSDLGSAGLLQGTIVALYGDHDVHIAVTDDELKSAQAMIKHAYDDFFQLDSVLNRSVLGDRNTMQLLNGRSPFFVVVPGSRWRGMQPAVGGLIDVAPTLLDILDIDQPPSFMGEPLLGKNSGVAVLPIPRGSAVSQHYIFKRGASNGAVDSSECLQLPARQPVDSSQCSELARIARDQLEISRLVVLNNLAGEISRQDQLA